MPVEITINPATQNIARNFTIFNPNILCPTKDLAIPYNTLAGDYTA